LNPLDKLSPKQAAVFECASRDDVEALCKMPLDLKDLEFTAGHLGSPLSQAIRNRSLRMVDFLLTRGVNPNLSFKNGDSPLHEACKAGRKDV
jgi:ankyrin repeat protein